MPIFHRQLTFPHCNLAFPHWQIAIIDCDPPIGNWKMTLRQNHLPIDIREITKRHWQLSPENCHPPIGNWRMALEYWHLDKEVGIEARM
jgi:hypothetical protein